MVTPVAVGNATFQYQKIFGEAEFFAGGVLNLDVGGAKAPKNSQDNAYVSEVPFLFPIRIPVLTRISRSHRRSSTSSRVAWK